ncbi:MAG: hypothetical protein ACAH95_10125 [Fimbriimonas sp.]
MTLSLLIATSVTLAAPQGVGKPKVYVATENRDARIGRLIWVAKDRAGKVLGKGNRWLTLKDVKVEVSDGAMGKLVSKNIVVGSHFKLDFASFPERSVAEVVGFGLTATRDDVDTFCWEWFNVDSPTKATKLQERGELGILIDKVEGGYDVLRTNFLSDISMRIQKSADGAGADPRWRLNILKGSRIDWPKLAHGKVLLSFPK